MLALGIGCSLEGWSALAPLRARLQMSSFRLGEQDATKLHSLLLQDGQIDVQRPAALASTSALPASALEDRIPTISIACSHDDLYSPEHGIIPNAIKTGRDWERRATFSYFENDVLCYEANAGLRIHGGSSREEPLKSFQLVFRRSYEGSPRAKPGVFFDGQSPAMQRIALINTSVGPRFLNGMAQEIAASVGCTTSRFQPVRVFLNGQRIPSGYFLFEHQSREFLKARHGHDDFWWVRLKAAGAKPRSGAFGEMWEWANSKTTSITMQGVAERYDLDDLCAWMFAITFCGTRDEEQGGYYKDKRDPHAVWSSLTWDMDGSFNRGRAGEAQRFDFSSRKGLRHRMFRRLCISDPAFRIHYREFSARMLQDRVSPGQIRALAAKYRAWAGTEIFAPNRRTLLPALDTAEAGLLDRHDRYLDELDRFFATLKES